MKHIFQSLEKFGSFLKPEQWLLQDTNQSTQQQMKEDFDKSIETLKVRPPDIWKTHHRNKKCNTVFAFCYTSQENHTTELDEMRENHDKEIQSLKVRISNLVMQTLLPNFDLKKQTYHKQLSYFVWYLTPSSDMEREKALIQCSKSLHLIEILEAINSSW